VSETYLCGKVASVTDVRGGPVSSSDIVWLDAWP
jgi:hypothetical protein